MVDKRKKVWTERYRPETLDDIIGQKSIKALKKMGEEGHRGDS